MEKQKAVAEASLETPTPKKSCLFQGLCWQLIGGIVGFLTVICNWTDFVYVCVYRQNEIYSEGNTFRLFYLNKLTNRCHISLPLNITVCITMDENLILY